MKTKALVIQTQSFLIASLLLANSAVFAAEVKVMISGGFTAAYKTLTPELERATHNTVARGEAEIGFQQISERKPVPGVDIVGPPPAGAQKATLFAAGIVTGAKEPVAGKQLIDLLASPANAGAITKSGMQPAGDEVANHAQWTACLLGRAHRDGARSVGAGPGQACRGTALRDRASLTSFWRRTSCASSSAPS